MPETIDSLAFREEAASKDAKNRLRLDIRSRAQYGVLPFLWCILAAHIAADDDLPQEIDKEEDAFSVTSVFRIHVEVSAEEYRAMQPPPAFFGPGGPAPQPQSVQSGRDSEHNLFGTEFPWAKASLFVDGQPFENVAVRYTGGITYMVSAMNWKRPLAVQLNRFDDHHWQGMTSLELHSMPLDPSRSREVLALQVFQALGVPTPRTAFAEVTLDVPQVHQEEFLGLYTVVEGIDAAFLRRHFTSDAGLLMHPFGMRGIDFLGDDWSVYPARYRPKRAATEDEVRRVIAFARLVNLAPDAEFASQIDQFIDVDAFLRFMAANSLTSNLESFFALGHNYYLYLEPESGRFYFIPEALEFSLANFLLLGSAEELMDLSLRKPYPEANALCDRLLALEHVQKRYQELLEELTKTVFTSERLLGLVDSIEFTTSAIREREAVSNGPLVGLGGPGFGPQPPDLATFIRVRTASVADQLAGIKTGYVPRPFSVGPFTEPGPAPRGRGSAEPIDETTFLASVHVPDRFEATLFATPPAVNYPVAIAAAPGGEIYVAIDEQGSLGRTPGGGRIVRCVDRDDDGRVDEVTVFARVEHPRGVCYRDGSVWVMHPPTLSVFHDDDGDGVADRQVNLVTGLTTNLIDERGGDHTTNCVRMGIDGWLYLGVGDYGILQAEGADGTNISLRGGGIVRVRPDGTELEIFCTGLRNPFDLAIDPYLNLFTRDNTNDGGGWDTRVSHLMQTAEYGYPRLFANFTDEIMPTLGAFGGGGGTGGLFIQDSHWPDGYRNMLLTGDWGTSEVYRHNLTSHGPTFDLEQEVFLSIPRATGMDIDGNGRLYIASWWSGEASVYVGPNVGFVTRVVPKDFQTTPFPDLVTATNDELVSLIAAPQAVMRLHVQGELLSRGRNSEVTDRLLELAANPLVPLEGRIAAIFTLKQLDGKEAHASLLALAEDTAVREFVFRALTDRVTELDGIDSALFVTALQDESPRVRAQALISLGRLRDPSVATHILPLAVHPVDKTETTARPHQNDPDPERVIPHLAVRTLVTLKAHEACFEALGGPHWRGALRALRLMHDPEVVEGLIQRLGSTSDVELRREILITLIRLYHREADYDGSWWGIRPDSSGPYYDRIKWEASDRIEAVLTIAVLDADPALAAALQQELRRHGVSLAGLPLTVTAATVEENQPIVIPEADPNNPHQIGNMPYEAVLERVLTTTGDPERGLDLFRTQSCIACHTTADGQTPKGPHMVDIGRRYRTEELVESILKPGAKIAQGYEMYLFATLDGHVMSGFIVSQRADAVLIRETSGVQHELRRSEIEAQVQQSGSAMPERLVNHLTPEQLADLIAYLQSLK